MASSLIPPPPYDSPYHRAYGPYSRENNNIALPQQPPPPYQNQYQSYNNEFSNTYPYPSQSHTDEVSRSTWGDCTGKHTMLRILVGIILAGLGAYLAYVCISQGLSRLHHTPAFGGFLIYMGSAFGLFSFAELAWTSWNTWTSDEFSAKEAAAQTAALFATPVAAVALPIFACCMCYCPWLGRF